MASTSRLIRYFGLGIIVCGLIAASAIVPVSATSEKSAPSQEKLSAIANNCSTIKQSLKQLQKADSKTRAYLGTTYETITNKFITPLNLRLVRNNHPTIFDIQPDFSDEQANFRDSYTAYMREMENLIALNCQTEPEKFYNQLVTVRERRSNVQLAVEKLKKLTSAQYKAVVELSKELAK